MKVESNKKLFDEIKGISDNVRDLGAIVQNNTEITEKDLNDFVNVYTRQCIQDIRRWQIKVKKYILEINNNTK